METKWPSQLKTVDVGNRKREYRRSSDSTNVLELISAEIISSCDPRLSPNVPSTSVYAPLAHGSPNISVQRRLVHGHPDEEWLTESLCEEYRELAKNLKVRVHINPKFLPILAGRAGLAKISAPSGTAVERLSINSEVCAENCPEDTGKKLSVQNVEGADMKTPGDKNGSERHERRSQEAEQVCSAKSGLNIFAQEGIGMLKIPEDPVTNRTESPRVITNRSSDTEQAQGSSNHRSEESSEVVASRAQKSQVPVKEKVFSGCSNFPDLLAAVKLEKESTDEEQCESSVLGRTAEISSLDDADSVPLTDPNKYARELALVSQEIAKELEPNERGDFLTDSGAFLKKQDKQKLKAEVLLLEKMVAEKKAQQEERENREKLAGKIVSSRRPVSDNETREAKKPSQKSATTDKRQQRLSNDEKSKVIKGRVAERTDIQPPSKLKNASDGWLEHVEPKTDSLEGEAFRRPFVLQKHKDLAMNSEQEIPKNDANISDDRSKMSGFSIPNERQKAIAVKESLDLSVVSELNQVMDLSIPKDLGLRMTPDTEAVVGVSVTASRHNQPKSFSLAPEVRKKETERLEQNDIVDSLCDSIEQSQRIVVHRASVALRSSNTTLPLSCVRCAVRCDRELCESCASLEGIVSFSALSNYATSPDFSSVSTGHGFEAVSMSANVEFMDNLKSILPEEEFEVEPSEKSDCPAVHLTCLCPETQFESQFYECFSIRNIHLGAIRDWMKQKPLEMVICGRLKSAPQRLTGLPGNVTEDPVVVECLCNLSQSLNGILEASTAEQSASDDERGDPMENECQDATELLASNLFEEVRQHLEFLTEGSGVQKQTAVQSLRSSSDASCIQIQGNQGPKDSIPVLKRPSKYSLSNAEKTESRNSRVRESNAEHDSRFERDGSGDKKLDSLSGGDKLGLLPRKGNPAALLEFPNSRSVSNTLLSQVPLEKPIIGDGPSVVPQKSSRSRNDSNRKKDSLQKKLPKTDASKQKSMYEEGEQHSEMAAEIEMDYYSSRQEPTRGAPSALPLKRPCTQSSDPGDLALKLEVERVYEPELKRRRDSKEAQTDRRLSNESDHQRESHLSHEPQPVAVRLDKTSEKKTTKHGKDDKVGGEPARVKGKKDKKKDKKKEAEDEGLGSHLRLTKPADSKVALSHLLSDKDAFATSNTDSNSGFPLPLGKGERQGDREQLTMGTGNSVNRRNDDPPAALDSSVCSPSLVRCFLDENTDYEEVMQKLTNVISGDDGFETRRVTPQSSFVWALALAVFEDKARECPTEKTCSGKSQDSKQKGDAREVLDRSKNEEATENLARSAYVLFSSELNMLLKKEYGCFGAESVILPVLKLPPFSNHLAPLSLVVIELYQSSAPDSGEKNSCDSKPKMSVKISKESGSEGRVARKRNVADSKLQLKKPKLISNDGIHGIGENAGATTGVKKIPAGLGLRTGSTSPDKNTPEGIPSRLSQSTDELDTYNPLTRDLADGKSVSGDENECIDGNNPDETTVHTSELTVANSETPASVTDANHQRLLNAKGPRFMQTFRQNQIAKRKSQKENLRTATGGRLLHSKQTLNVGVVKPRPIGMTLEETLAVLSGDRASPTNTTTSVNVMAASGSSTDLKTSSQTSTSSLSTSSALLGCGDANVDAAITSRAPTVLNPSQDLGAIPLPPLLLPAKDQVSKEPSPSGTASSVGASATAQSDECSTSADLTTPAGSEPLQSVDQQPVSLQPEDMDLDDSTEPLCAPPPCFTSTDGGPGVPTSWHFQPVDSRPPCPEQPPRPPGLMPGPGPVPGQQFAPPRPFMMEPRPDFPGLFPRGPPELPDRFPHPRPCGDPRMWDSIPRPPFQPPQGHPFRGGRPPGPVGGMMPPPMTRGHFGPSTSPRMSPSSPGMSPKRPLLPRPPSASPGRPGGSMSIPPLFPPSHRDQPLDDHGEEEASGRNVGPDSASDLRIYVFNKDKPICLSVQRYLEFKGATSFDPFNIGGLRHMQREVFKVLVHDGDLKHINDIPNLLHLKRDARVTFASYKDVQDVKFRKYVPLFPSAGLIVIENAALLACHPDALQRLCDFIQFETKEKKAWSMVISPQVISLMDRARQDQSDSGSRLMENKRLLEHLKANGIVQEMASDFHPLTPVDYHAACETLQMMHCRKYRHFIFISDLPKDHPNSNLFFGAGIDIMTVPEFLNTFVGKPVEQLLPGSV